ncbi:MAG TPA: CAP domain-containing protein [Dehalococcoidales bacterium]|nr:CAP domain-containing protein [Dehalococcoidales bacterium]
MPIGDRDYIRGNHPPYCTCKECTDRRLGKLQSGSRLDRLPPRRKPSGPLLGCFLTLAVVFILLLLGLVVWSLWGGQTSPSTNPPTAVTEPFPQSPATNVPSSISTPPPVKPIPVPETVKPPATPVVPSAPVKPSVYQHEELVAYALELINIDREANGLEPVTLGSNNAAQKHAEERLANKYLSHWGMDGLKPYMRYTLAGGENYEAENGFSTETIWYGGRDPSYRRDPKEMLEQAQEGLMTSPGHRKNILDKWHKKVNLGIAYDNERLDLVQQFEGDYIDFSELPSISDSVLSMTGKVTIGTIENVVLYYDPLPQPLTPEQLDVPPYDYAYGLGEDIGTILPPLPPNYFYTDLFPNDVIAITWDIESDGSFTIEADVSPILEEGKGVYTIVVWVQTGGEFVGISNYSIFIQ